MFDALERRYLLKLALECRRNGLDAAETRHRISARIGAMTGDNRLRCAIRHVFDTET